MILKSIGPWWLLAGLAAPLAVFAIWQIRKEWPHKQKRNYWLRRLALVSLLLLIALRPSIPGGNAPSGSLNLDVFFVADTSGSIMAEDYQNGKPRFEGIKSDITSLANNLSGARFSLVSFDYATTRQLPLTSDTTALQTAVSVLQQEDKSYSNGSRMDQTLEYLKKALAEAQTVQPDRGRVVFFMSDGENTRSGEQQSLGELKRYIDGGAVLGYGTATGAKMKGISGGYITDPNNKTPPYHAISKLDEQNLRRVAKELGIAYHHRTEPNNTQNLLSDINIRRVENHSRPQESYLDLYWLLAIILSGLLILELGLLLMKLPKIPKKGSSS